MKDRVLVAGENGLAGTAAEETNLPVGKEGEDVAQLWPRAGLRGQTYGGVEVLAHQRREGLPL